MLNTTDSIGFRLWGQGISVKRDDTIRTHVKDRGIKKKKNIEQICRWDNSQNTERQTESPRNKITGAKAPSLTAGSFGA